MVGHDIALRRPSGVVAGCCFRRIARPARRFPPCLESHLQRPLSMPKPLLPQTISPRFDDPNADIALISSDNVRFNVRSGFLLGSGVFEDMLSIKTGKVEKGAEVRLEETAATLELLLSFMVRGAERPVLDFEGIKKALVLADK